MQLSATNNVNKSISLHPRWASGGHDARRNRTQRDRAQRQNLPDSRILLELHPELDELEYGLEKWRGQLRDLRYGPVLNPLWKELSTFLGPDSSAHFTDRDSEAQRN